MLFSPTGRADTARIISKVSPLAAYFSPNNSKIHFPARRKKRISGTDNNMVRAKALRTFSESNSSWFDPSAKVEIEIAPEIINNAFATIQTT